jgi:ABC-type bacteriocin/lantibiotic exporter with double-glycine peptidase domain
VDIEHFQQPNGHTCGPAAVYMLSRALGQANSFSEISRLCLANPVFGSLPVFVGRALRRLGLPARRATARSAADLMPLTAGSLVLALGVAEGYPHWFLVSGWDGSVFTVADPASGPVKCPAADMDQRLDARRMLPKFRIARSLIGTAYQVACPTQEGLKARRLVGRMLA